MMTSVSPPGLLARVRRAIVPAEDSFPVRRIPRVRGGCGTDTDTDTDIASGRCRGVFNDIFSDTFSDNFSDSGP